jgi:hypothetical protein
LIFFGFFVLVCLVPGNVREKKDNLKPLERITEKPVYPLVVLGSMVLFDFESLFEKMLAFILCYKELICNEINIDFFFQWCISTRKNSLLCLPALEFRKETEDMFSYC